MKKIAALFGLAILLFTSSLTTNSCGRTQETVSCFPDNVISVILNLNLPAYQNLQNPSGWIYVDEQSSGSRGLIVVRTNNGFNVYDRNAPHLCPDSNTTLNVTGGMKITCPKDGAEWILITGEPIKIAPLAPKKYPYSYNAATNVLSIFN